MTMITPSYLGETIEYSSLHACRSTLEDPTIGTLLYSINSRLQPAAAWILRDRQYDANAATLGDALSK